MTIQQALRNKKMSIYRLAKLSGVPYATVNDIVNCKTQLEKCSAETVYRLARTLEVTIEELLKPYMIERGSFENFKSYICHLVKEQGDIDFIINTIESEDIRIYFDRKWYPESLYLLAMLDYLSRINDVPLCEEYDDLRKCKLEKTLYPAGIRAMSAVMKDESVLKDSFDNAIPEFKRFNIVENEVRNVV